MAAFVDASGVPNDTVAIRAIRIFKYLLTGVNTVRFIVAAAMLAFCTGAIARPIPNQTVLIVDDQEFGYDSALAAIEDLPKRKDMRPVEQVAPGVLRYGHKENRPTFWYVFAEGHSAYPTVVRRRVVGPPNDFVVKTAFLCDASEEACAEVRQIFNAMDERKSDE